MGEPLLALRDSIDAIDRQIVALLGQRAALAQSIGELKHAGEGPVYRPEREAEVLRKVAAANTGPLPDSALAAVFREVMSACRALERMLRVAYLGPAGTFSELALLRQFGTSVEALPAPSIDETIRAAEAGAVDFAIAPIENSTEGSVTRTLDLLLSTPLAIVAEVSLPVNHHLLTRSGTMEGVVRIAAHAQALAQCVNWLNQQHPGIERQPVASNAEAARLASVDPTIAAIAGESAAGRYGLTAVASNIQDDPGNRTRFVVLGSRRRVRHARTAGAARRVDDPIRVASGEDGRLGVLLLRRHRRASERAEGRRGARSVARLLCLLQEPRVVSRSGLRSRPRAPA